MKDKYLYPIMIFAAAFGIVVALTNFEKNPIVSVIGATTVFGACMVMGALEYKSELKKKSLLEIEAELKAE